MPRKLILDVDPGIDDAVAICMALFDPNLEVVAVTSVGGNVPPHQAARNVQLILSQMDPVRWPRIGAATAPEHGLPTEGRRIFGPDGLGGVPFEGAIRRDLHPSEKVLCDEVRAAPEAVTILALGPLTNIARAFLRDPQLPSIIGQLVIVGGTVSGPGNITPAAEFNIYCDPQAARTVFRSPCTKTLIPLDVTNRVELTLDILHRLPDETTRVGRFVRKLLPAAFRAYRQELGLEAIRIHDVVGLVAVTHPELFTFVEMAGDVETMGELTLGATVFDRRRVPAWRHNIAVATEVDKQAVIEEIIRSLHVAATIAEGTPP